jgi:hypothetical protein
MKSKNGLDFICIKKDFIACQIISQFSTTKGKSLLVRNKETMQRISADHYFH